MIPVGTLPVIDKIRQSLPQSVYRILVQEFKAGACLITLPVQWGDLDAFQHLNNVATLRYFESARMAHFYQTFQPFLDASTFSNLVQGKNYGPIVKNVSCTYRCQVRFPDTVTLAVKVPPETIQSDRFQQHFLAVSHVQQKAFAHGFATIVMFDYNSQKKANLSSQIMKALSASHSLNSQLSQQNTHHLDNNNNK